MAKKVPSSALLMLGLPLQCMLGSLGARRDAVGTQHHLCGRVTSCKGKKLKILACFVILVKCLSVKLVMSILYERKALSYLHIS